MKHTDVKHILVVAPTSVSRAAMSIPALAGVLRDYPEVRMTIATTTLHSPLFRSLEGVSLLFLDEEQYCGRMGLLRLWRGVCRLGVDGVVNLSLARRSRVQSLFPLRARKVRLRAHKGEYRAITRKYRKTMNPLPSIGERVCPLFEQLGLRVTPDVRASQGYVDTTSSVVDILLGEKCGPWVGLSLLSPNHGVCYPIPLAAKLVELLTGQGIKVVLFGADEYERQFAEGMQMRYEGAVSVALRLSLEEQMNLLGRLDVVVCTDGDVMRLAALVGAPLVALWGATHPYIRPLLGAETVVTHMQCELPCRPCSVDGRRRCLFGHYKCMNSLTPEMVTERVKRIIAE